MGDVFSQWSVAWICSFIYFLLLGVARLSGLLYLAAIGRYNADRSQASLPFVLCYTVRNVTGPLIGYLGRRVEIRLLIASGCFLSALGAGACFFAEDITTVSVLWGGVFGIGFGLGTILLPEVLNQHFDKYISNANGIALGGECVAGFVLPVFVEFVLDTYGASGTFLILSGLILHGVPAALLLKPPSKASHESTRISEPARNRVGGQYSALPGKGCDNMSDANAVKTNHRKVLNTCNRTNYQVDYIKTDNSEVLDKSESFSVTDPLVQNRHGAASLKDDYESSRTTKHHYKHHYHGYLIPSKTIQHSNSQITTNYCNCNHCNAKRTTSIAHYDEISCARHCVNSANNTQISPENLLGDQSSLHGGTLNHCSAIVSLNIQSNESSNLYHDIQPTVPTTADHNQSNAIITQLNHSITNSCSVSRTEASNQSNVSSGHNLLKKSQHHKFTSITNSGSVPSTESSNQSKESSDHNHSYCCVTPQSHSITHSGSVPCSESINQYKESSRHNLLEESSHHNLSNSITPPHAHSITNSDSVPRTESSNQYTESPGHISPFGVFLDPAFILILFTQSSMIFIFTTIMTIIVDFSRDAGVLAHQEVYILMCLSVSDMLGRFGLGWVTDAQYMSNVSFSALCYAGSGLVMVALVFLRGFAMVLVVAFFIGLFLGGLLIVCPGIIMDHIEKEEVTMALASRFVLYAPMSFSQSLLIGFFREKLGSYDGLFYVLAVHCFVCCAFSLFVPLASKYRDSRKEAKRL